ncbi:DUF4167 domain-containing protein [Sneathiella sp.]|uniref:DUF4167 domain-containing protein n=1 Tax=Sneathiella sp. TaxID=1964365 RepID=UPI003562945C
MRVSSNRRPRGGRTNSGNNRAGVNAPRPGSNNNRRSNNGNRNYDSNGPDGKIRGTATQVYDKYIALATDAYTSGDRVAAENYFQHAEHYFRIVAANNLAKQEKQLTEQQSNDSNEDESNSEETPAVDRPVAEAEPVKPVKRVPKNKAVKETAADLSSTEQPVVDFPADTDTASQGDNPAAHDPQDENDKPKRKVSRTRTLRRRTSSRAASEEDTEEVSSTE